MTSLRIGITLGDPGGIGPEIILKTLLEQKSLEAVEYILYGPKHLLVEESKRLGSAFAADLYEFKDSFPEFRMKIRGRPDPANGKASFLWFEQAVQDAESGTLHAIVTAPISKHSWNMAGIHYAGHTDYFNRFHPEAIMSFFSNTLSLALYTHHIPLREAIGRIRKEDLLNFFRRIHSVLNPEQTPRYRFLVAGLNPHAGEEGMIGSEEKREISPAVFKARSEGIPIDGPYPPDTICRMALNRPDLLVLSLYHDQGLIAFKLSAFEEGVNVTLGLPYVRTSPDHGTAFDIAGKGQADSRSMIQALDLAGKLAAARGKQQPSTSDPQ